MTFSIKIYSNRSFTIVYTTTKRIEVDIFISDFEFPSRGTVPPYMPLHTRDPSTTHRHIHKYVHARAMQTSERSSGPGNFRQFSVSEFAGVAIAGEFYFPHYVVSQPPLDRNKLIIGWSRVLWTYFLIAACSRGLTYGRSDTLSDGGHSLRRMANFARFSRSDGWFGIGMIYVMVVNGGKNRIDYVGAASGPSGTDVFVREYSIFSCESASFVALWCLVVWKKVVGAAYASAAFKS